MKLNFITDQGSTLDITSWARAVALPGCARLGGRGGRRRGPLGSAGRPAAVVGRPGAAASVRPLAGQGRNGAVTWAATRHAGSDGAGGAWAGYGGVRPGGRDLAPVGGLRSPPALATWLP